MSRWPVIVASGVALAVIGAALVLRPSRPLPLVPELAVARGRVARLEDEIAALRLEVERLRSLAAPVTVAERTSETRTPDSPVASKPEAAPGTTDDEVADPRLAQAAADWLAKRFPDLFENLSADEARYLRSLDLSKQTLTPEELALLAGLGHLADLNLGRNGTDDALKSLSDLSHLRQLNLGGASFTVAGLQSLPSENLRTLLVHDTPLTDQDVAAFRRLDHLQKLKLDRTQVSDVSMASLGDCRSLRHIELDSTGVTAAGLRTLLQRNPDLTRIEVRRTAVSQDDAVELHREFPNTVIVCEQPPTAAQLFGGR
jgi:hypothetical protein